jgi:multidrug efflux pump subunit AcrA (membrane-fusion protein)
VSRKAKIIIASGVLLVAVGLGAYFIVNSATAGALVDSAKATSSDLGVTVSASGKVRADLSADVYPGTSGIIAEVYVSEGATVSAGQRLASLDAAQLDLAVTQAKSGLAQAESQLSLVDLQAPFPTDLAAASASVDAAQGAYDMAKDTYDALAAVYPSSSATVSAAAQNVTQARSALMAATSALAKLQRSSDVSKQQTAARAGVTSAKAAYDLAVANRAKADIVAPISGKVFFSALGVTGADGLVPKAARGAAVGPQAALFSIVDLDAQIFAAEVDEADIDRIRSGMKASVSLDSFPGKAFATSVSLTALASQPTATGGTVFIVDLPLRPPADPSSSA